MSDRRLVGLGQRSSQAFRPATGSTELSPDATQVRLVELAGVGWIATAVLMTGQS